MNMRRRLLLATLTGAIPPEWASAADRGNAPSRAPIEGELPSLDGATAWLNSPPLTTPGLRGKVVLIDFWTYSCINWLRSLPYVRAWADKYRGQGLVTIGVHTPEFAFESDIENVRRAASGMNVGYPIALDSDYAIWNAFHNEYWPALYLIDARGRVRHHRFGEGEYEQTERIIRQLLSEAGSADDARDLVSVDARGVEAAADWRNLESPENYVGYGRAEGFSSPGGTVRDRRHTYEPARGLERDRWAVSGDWTIGRQRATANASGARIAYRFHARDLHLVMGPATRASPVRFRVSVDGRPPAADHGADVDEQGNGTVTEPKLHQLIRQTRPIADRLFEIEFLDPGLDAYSFTFG